MKYILLLIFIIALTFCGCMSVVKTCTNCNGTITQTATYEEKHFGYLFDRLDNKDISNSISK